MLAVRTNDKTEIMNIIPPELSYEIADTHKQIMASPNGDSLLYIQKENNTMCKEYLPFGGCTLLAEDITSLGYSLDGKIIASASSTGIITVFKNFSSYKI